MENKSEIDKVLDINLIVYSYLTTDNEIGTIITHPDLSPIFDKNKLFTMDIVESKTFKLRDILSKGFVSIGSTDIMDPVDIIYPLIGNNKKPCIRGKYIHGSRKLIFETTNIDFTYDPESDDEVFKFGEENELNVNWLVDDKK